MPATTHTGGCHCGQIRFAVTLDLSSAVTCNCSICSKKGLLLAFAPTSQFRLDSGEDLLTDYTFHKHIVQHRFCRLCGTQSFSRGKMPDGTEVAAINLRCLDNIDLTAIKPKEIDGRSR